MHDFSHQIVAIDTNILVRIFVADDDVQHQKAVALIDQVAKFFVPTTVFIETVWVLTSRYELAKADVFAVLSDFIEHSDKLLLNHDEVRAGLALLDIGGDFADGVNQYLGKIGGGQPFISFDKKAVHKLTSLGQKAVLL